MRNLDAPQQSMSQDVPAEQNSEQIEQRRREVHQRLEELNEERRLRRLISDEWED